MKNLFATVAVLALMSGIAPFAAAQSAPTAPSSGAVPAPGSTYDNGAVRSGGPIASDPSGTDTRTNNQATNPPGAAGPVEGGPSAHPGGAMPKENSNREEGGVQNPGLGSGINGSSPRQ